MITVIACERLCSYLHKKAMLIKSIHLKLSHLTLSHAAPSGLGVITEFKYARVNNSHVEFRWQGPTLTDARGFPHYEMVIREGRMDSHLAVHDLSAALARLKVVRNISVTNSYTTQDGLLSSITYTVQVRVFTAGGKGQYTYPCE